MIVGQSRIAEHQQYIVQRLFLADGFHDFGQLLRIASGQAVHRVAHSGAGRQDVRQQGSGLRTECGNLDPPAIQFIGQNHPGASGIGDDGGLAAV